LKDARRPAQLWSRVERACHAIHTELTIWAPRSRSTALDGARTAESELVDNEKSALMFRATNRRILVIRLIGAIDRADLVSIFIQEGR
jgi:hypothetical protein